jgi:hypothetical protein
LLNAYYIRTGILTSTNYSEDADGNIVGAKFDLDQGIIKSNNVDFTGKITATSGQIGNWMLNDNMLNSDATFTTTENGEEVKTIYRAYMQTDVYI